MERIVLMCKNICCYLPSKVNCCDKIGFLCFYCNCLYIPSCIDFWCGDCIQVKCPMQNVQSYDDFMMNDQLDV